MFYEVNSRSFCIAQIVYTNNDGRGGSPGLVVMGRDSRSEGRGFDSWYRILDGHFFTYICCKNCIVCLKRPKINEEEAVVGPFFLKTMMEFLSFIIYFKMA